ncbi:MAG: hypothetical protein ACTHMJ_00730 [Thermomicrobiales bacterium]
MVAHPTGSPHLILDEHQPLVAVPLVEAGQEVVHYFPDDEAPVSDQDVAEAIALAGAWSDLDWDDLERELSRS